MSPKPLKVLAATSLAALMASVAPPSFAFNFGDMMNPGRWLGGNRDRYDDYYDDYGPYGPGPWGPYGAPYSAPYGGVPGYAPAPYGVAPMAPAAPAPAQSAPSNQGEIDALKRRIEELEAAQKPAASQPAPSTEWPSAPAFRPMNQY